MNIYHIVGDFGHAVVIADNDQTVLTVCKALGYITYVEIIGTSHETSQRTVIVNYKG